MPYLRRTDSQIAVTIDSNVWNLFHTLDVRLSEVLPNSRFLLFIPREIEIETVAIPDSKPDLKAYISYQMQDAGVTVTAIFGFAHEGGGPERHGGFGFGTFQSEDARAYYATVRMPHLLGKGGRNSGLTDNEGDAALGAESLSSVVLTRDLKKAGPLLVALEHGGKVFDMRPYEQAIGTLADDIARYHYAPT
jgi:hypothetical protein